MPTKPIPNGSDIHTAYQQGVEAVILLFQQTFLELSERLQQMEDQLAKNSNNSGKPPSSDGYKKVCAKKQEKAEREKERRTSGASSPHIGNGRETRQS